MSELACDSVLATVCVGECACERLCVHKCAWQVCMHEHACLSERACMHVTA